MKIVKEPELLLLQRPGVSGRRLGRVEVIAAARSMPPAPAGLPRSEPHRVVSPLPSDVTIAVSNGTRISVGMLSHYGYNTWWEASDWVHGEATLGDGEAYSGMLRFVQVPGASMVELGDGRVFRENVVHFWRVDA